MSVRSLIKDFIPPIVARALRPTPEWYGFSGDYASWSEATAAAAPYETDVTIFGARAKAEQRNSSEPPLAVLAGFLMAQDYCSTPLDVLDYSGGMAPHYWQLRKLTRIKSWHVVELPDVVDYAVANFTGTGPSFSTKIPADIPSVLLLSGVLQYLPEPTETVRSLLGLQPAFVVHDRLPLMRERERIMVQKIPKHLGGQELPWRALNDQILSALFADYELLIDHDYGTPGPGSDASYRARVYRRRS